VPEHPGLGPRRERLCPLAPLVGSYQRLLVVSINVAAGATEIATSDELSQPFRVETLRLSGLVLGSVDVRGAVCILRDNPTAGADPGLQLRPVWYPTGENANNQLVRVSDLEGAGLVGQVVRGVPCRVALVCQNPGGAGIAIVASVLVTFLVEADERGGAYGAH